MGMHHEALPLADQPDDGIARNRPATAGKLHGEAFGAADQNRCGGLPFGILRLAGFFVGAALQPARDDGHAWRARACAIMTGIGTVKEDDPQLTVRAVETPRQPRRIVLDSDLEIVPQARVLQGGGSWIIAASPVPHKADALRNAGNEVLLLPDANGQVDLPALMRELGKRMINELHVEAGEVLNGALLRAGLVDELLLYVAPSILGEARGMFALAPLETLENKHSLRFHEVKHIGEDLRILARF